MPYRVKVSTLNASTIDILNVIRQNASAQYQDLVPEVAQVKDIPKVGEVLFGYPAMANEFISALVGRIAEVRVKSATFNNRFSPLKKGYLDYGETIEEVFVNIIKARDFSTEKAADRELRRSLPDVRSAFHILNYKVQYPITIERETLRSAFLSADGVQNLITKIMDAVYTSADYDEYLLFKYVMIKAISHGEMHVEGIDLTEFSNTAVAFRGFSNALEFMSGEYNMAGVLNTTPKDRQWIFMDSFFNAQYDVDILSAAFNMDKSDYMGRVTLIDDWSTFDNDRFSVIMENSDMIEPVTDDELALTANVKAVLIDEDWFQFYDNLTMFTETNVASGMYWNYFLNVWKTISTSPFANAIAFVDDTAEPTAPETIDVIVTGNDKSAEATVITVELEGDESLFGQPFEFIQTEDATTNGIAVHKYGAYLFPAGETTTDIELHLGGVVYTGEAIGVTDSVGAVLTLAKAIAITESEEE